MLLLLLLDLLSSDAGGGAEAESPLINSPMVFGRSSTAGAVVVEKEISDLSTGGVFGPDKHAPMFDSHSQHCLGHCKSTIRSECPCQIEGPQQNG